MTNIRKVIEKNRSSSSGNIDKKSSEIKITLIICAVMLLLAYGGSSLISYFSKQSTIIEDVKQYNITASTVFNMSEPEYYVLFYDKTGTDAIVLNSIIDSYRKKNTKPLYVVDLSKDYNKSILSDTPNLGVSSNTELKVTTSTLLKIKEGKNDGYYESILIIEKELNK